MATSCLWSLLFHEPLILQFCFHLPSVFSLFFCACSLFLEKLLTFFLVLALFLCAPTSLLPLVLLSFLCFLPPPALVFSSAFHTSPLLLGPCDRIAVQDWSFLLTGISSPWECNLGLRKTEKWPRRPEFSSQPQCCLAPMGYPPMQNSMIFYGFSVCCQAVSSHIPWFWIEKKGNKINCWKTNHRRKKLSAQQNWPYKEKKKKILCCLLDTLAEK